MKTAEITVTKIQAAQRQLDTAISLWFTGGDDVSIHTLAGASHQIIHDLNRKNKGRDLIFDSLVIKDEFLKEFNQRVRAPMVFFKHADKDPTPSHTFNPEISELFMLFSIFGLELLGIPRTPPEFCLINWTSLHKPQCLTKKGKQIYADPAKAREIQTARGIPKNDFYEAFILLSNRRRRPAPSS